MKKLKAYREYGAVFLLMLVIVGISVVGRPLESLDELWQYSFGSNVARGLLPYRDINLILPPLSVMIGGAVLSILGNRLIIYRILGALTGSVCLLLFYDIQRQLKVDRRFAFCMSIYAASFYCTYFTYDYNYLQLIVLMMIMDQLTRQESRGKEHLCHVWFLIGMEAGCCLLIKHSTGAVIFLAVFFLAVVLCFRERGKCVPAYCVGCFLPMLPFFCWLFHFRLAEIFWDYAFRGLSSFSGKNHIGIKDFLLYSGPLCQMEALLTAAAVTAGVIGLVKSQDRLVRRNWLILINLSGAGASVVYPIMDNAHFVIALLPILIMGIYALTNKMQGAKQIPKVLLGLITIMGLGISVCTLDGEDVIWSKLPHYEGIRIESSLEEQCEEIKEYLEGYPDQPVYVLDGAAVFYKIPMERYDKDFDLCLGGTWGHRSPEEVAKELLGKKGIMLLAAEGYGTVWQVPEEFIEYIKTHAVCIDHINKYDVYVAKDGYDEET